MANKINSLLSKKGWSGEEVGRAAVIHLVEQMEALSDPSKKPSLEIKDIERLRDSIKNDYDGRMFNKYIEIVHLLSDVVMFNQSYEQQFYNGFYRLIADVSRATFAATTYLRTCNSPMVMTQSQYDEYYEAAQKELSEIKETPAGLFYHTLSYFNGDYGKDSKKPSIPKTIKDVTSAMKKNPFKDKAIFERIAKANGDGYYLFEDGTRSDELTEEEYQVKLKDTREKPSILDMDSGSIEFTKEYIRLRKVQLEGRRAGKSAEEIEKEEGEEYPIWVYETDLPDDITEWDIVFGDYSDAVSEVFYYDWGEDLVEGYNLFVKTFPELSAAIVEYLSSKDKKLKSLFTGNNSPDDELISWGELAELKVLNYAYMITPTEDAIRDQYNEGRPEQEKTRSFDIAILKERSFTYNDFCNPLFDANKKLLEEIKKPVSDVYRVVLVEPALKQIYALHFIISFIRDMYDLPELSALLPPIEVYEEKIEAVNGLIVLLYETVKDDEEKANIVIDGAKLIDIEDLKPTEAAKEKATNLFKSGKITKQSLNNLIDILVCNGEGAADDE